MGGTGFMCYFAGPGGVRSALAQPVPGGTLEPTTIPKYQVPLLIPPVMPRAGRVAAKGGKTIDYYEIAVRPSSQQILPPGSRPRRYGATAPGQCRAGVLRSSTHQP
ncbi:hypothetical protein [Nannocystis pusilla]|uniref:hypothetical protein n=1 Tax=Nannocystis pusilla TaxID=889268 RepID=UPI003B7A9F41